MSEFKRWALRNLTSLVQTFHENGYLLVRGALEPAQVERLREGVLRAFAEPEDGYGAIIRVQLFERGEVFEETIDQPGIVEIAEAILGDDCHLTAHAAALTKPGETISEWHVDDTVRFPIPEGLTLPPEIPMPCTSLTVIYYLVDVPDELGPTQFVPKSHRSGRHPPPDDPRPTYKEQVPVSAAGASGDAVIYHHQLWHRGGPNLTRDGRRVTLHISYGCRFIAQRFYPFINYRMPERVLNRADPRRRRLLGVHPRGDD